MSCDILVRSYWKDMAWLELSLRAIDRFCIGFRETIIVIPRSSEPWLRRIEPLPGKVRVEISDAVWCRPLACLRPKAGQRPTPHDDYLGQQVTKLYADRFSDADLICHVDSDCIFSRPATPDDLLIDGKPVVVMRSYDSLGRHWPWRKPVEQFLGWPVEHDFMQRAPFVFPRWLYSELRAHAEAVHGVSIDEYVLSQPPRGFSEFNVLGAWAHRHHRDAFTWIDAEREPVPESPCRWYWSWGDLTAETRREIESLVTA